MAVLDKQDILIQVGNNASDLDICYLASKGKYGKPASVSYNRVNCFFVMHDSTGKIMGNVKRSYYLFAKEVLESTYVSKKGKIYRLSPIDETHFSLYRNSEILVNKDFVIEKTLPLKTLIDFAQEQVNFPQQAIKVKPEYPKLIAC